jgi:heat shock transcription factor
MPSIPQISQPFSPVPPDQVFRWNNGVDGSGFVDAGPPGVNSFAMLPTSGSYGQAISTPSTALARRPNNRALVPTTPRAPFDRAADGWNGYNEDPGYFQAAAMNMDEYNNIERLEEMAQRAKREAQAKRKQIPPFVQKLSRFESPPFFSGPLFFTSNRLTRSQLPGRVEEHRPDPLV